MEREFRFRRRRYSAEPHKFSCILLLSLYCYLISLFGCHIDHLLAAIIYLNSSLIFYSLKSSYFTIFMYNYTSLKIKFLQLVLFNLWEVLSSTFDEGSIWKMLQKTYICRVWLTHQKKKKKLCYENIL